MGPSLLTGTSRSYASKGNNCRASSSTCMTLLPRLSFYPVAFWHAKMIMNSSIPEEMSDVVLQNSYTLHAPGCRGLNPLSPEVWGHLNGGVAVTPGSLFDRAYKKNCVICSL